MTAVSILICTRDRLASLRETLESLGRIDVPGDLRAEAIVVDNGSADGTREFVEAFVPENGLPVVYVLEQRPGKSRALNSGLRAARGEVFLFSDDDVRFPPTWIEGVCGPILRGEADAVQGGIRWAPHLLEAGHHNAFLAAIVTSTEHKSPDELETALIGANMAVSRRAYEDVGEFDERLGPGALGLGEETLLGWQLTALGFRKMNVLDVQVEHHFDATRLTRAGILDLADRKGRSEGYIDYHWKHVRVSAPWARALALLAKETIRTILTPSAWPGRSMVPAWKYAYRSSRSRLLQIHRERGRERRYELRGRRALGRATSSVREASAGPPAKAT